MRFNFYIRDKRTSLSGVIRGRQMAEALGGTINGLPGDINIFVKIEPPENFPENSYLDILDEPRRIRWLRKHPKMKVIASSLSSVEFLKEQLKQSKNKIVYIPQHHCNYERFKSKWLGGKVGVIGVRSSIMADLDFDYTAQNKYLVRQDVVNFYKTIDIQIVYRTIKKPLKNPLKIVNAMSFGIPTVAHPEAAYSDVEGMYFLANTPTEAKELIERMKKDPKEYYNPEELREEAEKYHIENIKKKYIELL